MPLKLNCLEPLTAVACGLFAAAEGAPDRGLTAAALVGVAGLLSRFRENMRSSGVSETAALRRIGRAVFRDLDRYDSTVEFRDELTFADVALARLLPEVTFDGADLAKLSVSGSPEPMDEQAAELVLSRLAVRDATFAPPAGGAEPVARRFARIVVASAYRAVRRDAQLAPVLAVDFLLETNRSIALARKGIDLVDRRLAFQGEVLAGASDTVQANRDLLLRISSDMASLARRQGLSDEALMSLAKRVAENVGDVPQAIAQLHRAMDEFVELRNRAAVGSNLGGLLDAALRRIASNNEEGRLDAGASEAERAYAALLEEEEQLAAAKAALIQANIDQQRLRFDAPAVAKWMIVRREHEEATTLASGDLVAMARDAWREGGEKGLPLEVAVAMAFSHEARRLALNRDETGAAADMLGLVLYRRGEQSGSASSDHLAASLDAYGSALDSRPRSEVPLEWAESMSNMGMSHQLLGHRRAGSEGTDHLRASIRCYMQALEELTPVAAMAKRIETQNGLANTKQVLGERTRGGEGVALLREALGLYGEALAALPRSSLFRGSVLNNLGNTQRILAERLGGDEGRVLITDCIANYEGALAFRHRKIHPARWAMTMHNLGDAHAAVAALSSGTAVVEALRRAERALRDALEVRRRDTIAFGWAETTISLAKVRLLIAEEAGGDDVHLEAVRTDLAQAVSLLEQDATSYFRREAEDLLGRLDARIAREEGS